MSLVPIGDFLSATVSKIMLRYCQYIATKLVAIFLVRGPLYGNGIAIWQTILLLLCKQWPFVDYSSICWSLLRGTHRWYCPPVLSRYFLGIATGIATGIAFRKFRVAYQYSKKTLSTNCQYITGIWMIVCEDLDTVISSFIHVFWWRLSRGMG